MAKKFSQFPSASSISPGDSVVGLKDGENTRFSFATFLSAIQSLFVPTSRKVNNKALSSDISLNASDVGAVGTADVGVADGVASLDSNGKVPGTQLDLSGKQSTITANGILKGDGVGGVSAATAGTDYQVPLTFDNTPTANSANPVKSGGVYADVRTRVPNFGKGKNLLRNWYFKNPVNQRGNTSGTTANNVYFLDGWKTTYGTTSGTWVLTSSGLQITPAASTYAVIMQNVDDTLLNGFALTASSLLSDGTINTATLASRNSGTSQYFGSGVLWQIDGNGVFRHRVYETETIVAIKLELGTEQTLCHNEGTTESPVWVLNDMPDYEYELYRCMTSTADSTDTYANKTLATEQQLAYVESGTTASRDYLWDEFFWMGGILYRTTKRVNNGAPFTVGTNCEAVTSGGLNKMTMRLLGATVGSETIQPPSYQCLVLATRTTGAFLGILYTVTTTTWYLIRIHNGISDISLNTSTGAITFPSYTQYVYFW